MLMERSSAASLLIVVDQRDFVRGCLSCWLSGSNFVSLAVADVETGIGTDVFVQAAAALISVGALEQYRAWLGRQIGWLRIRSPTLPILLIVEADDVPTAASLVSLLNLQGYVPTCNDVAVVATALRLLMAGAPAYSSARNQSRPNPISPLSAREVEVLSFLLRGLPMKEIARQLGITARTVAFHKYNVMRRRGLQRNSDLIEFAMACKRVAPIGTCAITGPTTEQNRAALCSGCWTCSLSSNDR
jgi:DNA-binding NarL/FixJ family response regulator